ncbi:hypothetical protein H0H93_012068, partial [Arthromyces matolae]
MELGKLYPQTLQPPANLADGNCGINKGQWLRLGKTRAPNVEDDVVLFSHARVPSYPSLSFGLKVASQILYGLHSILYVDILLARRILLSLHLNLPLTKPISSTPVFHTPASDITPGGRVCRIAAPHTQHANDFLVSIGLDTPVSNADLESGTFTSTTGLLAITSVTR